MAAFNIIPAIDLMDGRAVRLRRGEAGTETVFSDDPAAVAQQFADAGASRIHLVDLDGAFDGVPKNLAEIENIRRAVSCELELGGGLRQETALKAALDAGIDFAIVGTAAAECPELFESLAERFGEHLIVGIDARDGIVVTRGWVRAVEALAAAVLARRVIALGVPRVIYTDVGTDGMMEGPNLSALSEMAKVDSIELIASGGICSLDDIQAIRNLELAAVRGVIIGRAIYEGQVDLAAAIEQCKND